MKRILLVDDEKNILTVCRKGLEKTSYTVDTSTNLNGARDLMETHRYDLIMIDVHLRGENGIDLYIDIKKNDPSQKVLIITGSLDQANMSRIVEPFGDRYIFKPFGIRTLTSTVDEILGS
ncbi:MAG: response regulator [Elusimicrobia bacterium]|nr:response regulator [Elusimicrobiota bacterium]